VNFIGLEHPSEQIWSIYTSKAKEYDEKLAEGWRGDMDGTLIFVSNFDWVSFLSADGAPQAGLFSATVTAFTVESYKTLKPDSGDLTVALLAQVSLQLAAISNGTQAHSTTPDQTPFRASTRAPRGNIIWILSLAFSLACALAAILVN
jgi:hypothetical protein